VREALSAVSQGIGDAIAAIPLAESVALLEDLLHQAGTQLDGLDLGRVTAVLEAITLDVDPAELRRRLSDEMGRTLAPFASLTADSRLTLVLSQFPDAVGRLGDLIEELDAGVTELREAAESGVSALEGVSFTTLGDLVVARIESVRDDLRAVDPSALSDLERVALRAGLQTLAAVDVPGVIDEELRETYAAAETAITAVLAELEEKLRRLRAALPEYRPSAVLGPVRQAVGEVQSALDVGLAHALTDPLRRLRDEARTAVAGISPSGLLEPLTDPYLALLEVVDRLDPESWAPALTRLHAQLRDAVLSIDLSPVLADLDDWRRELFGGVLERLRTALEEVLPAGPLLDFLDRIWPLLQRVNDALLGGSESSLQAIAVDDAGGFRLGALLDPLDAVYDRFLGLVADLPPGVAVSVFEQMRAGFGATVDGLDPVGITARLRAAQAELSELAPDVVLGPVLCLPALEQQFETLSASAPPDLGAAISGLRTRFGAVSAGVDADRPDGPMTALRVDHVQLAARLEQRCADIDDAALGEAYAGVRDLARQVPAFLRTDVALTRGVILAELSAARPSSDAQRLDRAADDLLSAVNPLLAGVAEAVDGFFAVVRDVLGLLDPLRLAPAARAAADQLGGVVDALDPTELIEHLRAELFLPVRTAVVALDPRQFEAHLVELREQALRLLDETVTGLIDEVTRALDEGLGAIRSAVADLSEQLETVIAAADADLSTLVADFETIPVGDIVGRLRNVLANVRTEFEQELDRVTRAFEEMLAAVPPDAASSREVPDAFG
jgi:hypothetical protein